MGKIILAGIAALTLVACSGSDRPLHDLRTNTLGPDEFSVLPSLPLELPETTTLPEPTPGGVNRTDRNPTGDAIAALGGSQAAAFAGGIPASDAALVASASRYGVEANIRSELATADAALRSRRSLSNVFNILGSDRYFRAYANQSLDAQNELARFRGLGVATPSAPPE